MKSYLCALALGLLSLNVPSYADLDTPELQPKAGQAEMDIAYDMTTGQADLEAAKQLNQAKPGEGALSIELQPKQHLAHFNLLVTKNDLTALNQQQLNTTNNALALWSSLFKFIPPHSCALQHYQVQPLPIEAGNPTSTGEQMAIDWSLNCPELTLVQSLELKMFTPLAPSLHTIRADWLTPDSLGTQVLTLPTVISFQQATKK